MKKRYKIITGYNPETKRHTIELFKQVTWWRWKFWIPSLFRSGTPRDVSHYSTAWQAEYNIAPEDINDAGE